MMFVSIIVPSAYFEEIKLQRVAGYWWAVSWSVGLLGGLEGSESLQQGRVGVVPHGEEPVCHWEAKVVLVQLD